MPAREGPELIQGAGASHHQELTFNRSRGAASASPASGSPHKIGSASLALKELSLGVERL